VKLSEFTVAVEKLYDVAVGIFMTCRRICWIWLPSKSWTRDSVDAVDSQPQWCTASWHKQRRI